ncbi:MAG: WYL domain-containing protein [Clostridia bacterium]|nr:WYL domain-containing protein [Clostridia bacterium]
MIMIACYPLAMSEEDIQARYAAIHECMNNRTAIKIKYRSNDNVVRERVIHPYELYMYNNAWFVLAYCELVKDIMYIKLNRIVSFEKMPNKFDYIYSYREVSKWHEWLDEHCMKRNGEWYEVKLKFTGKYAMIVQDYLYGRDQITECVDSSTTILTMKLQYKDSIPNFVLSFGEFCEVLEPEWLRDEVMVICEKIFKNKNI